MSWGSQNDFIGTEPPTPRRVYSFGQVKVPLLLALDTFDGTVRDFRISVAVQRYPNRETGRRVISDDLDASNSLASRPVANGFQAFLSERAVSQSNRVSIRHVCIRAKNDRRSRVIATVKAWSAVAGWNEPHQSAIFMQVSDQQASPDRSVFVTTARHPG
jgi:hypothetical protein